LANEEAMIKLRIDVDYPYPSRAKSFLSVALRIKKRKGHDYLKNSRIIAKMINESPKEVMAYWFFTPYTIPDKKLLDLLNPERHEVALHIATNPYREWKILENETNRKVNYYTMHGTESLRAQLLWGRKLGERQAKIPSDFPLKLFPVDPAFSLDYMVHERGLEGTEEAINRWVNKECAWAVHPDWLFKKGKKRGPFYQVLKSLLGVDSELGTLKIRTRVFAKIASYNTEWEKNIIPKDDFIQKLSERGIDVFTFLERKWSSPIINPPSTWIKTEDNVGMLEIKDYESWWSNVGKKTRNMVRRAEKSGIKVTVVEPSEKLAEGIWKIYNETPVRQGRAFPHYGEPLEEVKRKVLAPTNSTFIGAYLQEELVGFIVILYGSDIANISEILSMQKHRDKAVNNALLAKAVEVCASKGQRWLRYGRFGNHPSLDRFKESNGFVNFPLTRYYVPLTWKGEVAIRLGLHREFKDALPQWLKFPLIPVENWISRNRVRLKLSLGSRE
jgi:hypothetical protein